MTGRPPTPISELAAGRPQEMGKIKLGVRRGNRPASIDTFRFVSTDGEAVATLAAIYGGAVTVVDGKHDVVSDADEIDVVLPPDPLNGTPVYEMWSAAGCQRRCDGVTASVMHRRGDDVDYEDAPCLCLAAGALSCKPTTRLTVIIPQVRLGGVWQLKTSSWAAAREMQQMVALIEAAQSRGLVAAKLRVEKRTQQGSNRAFGVPILVLDATVHELSTGSAALTAPPAMRALPAASNEATAEQRRDLNRLFSAADEPARQAFTEWMHNRDLNPTDMTAADATDAIAFLLSTTDDDEF